MATPEETNEAVSNKEADAKEIVSKLKLSPKHDETSPKAKAKPKAPKKKSLLEQSASGIVLLISILLAYGGGRYIRTSIHGWVDKAIRDVLPLKDKGKPRIWTITPNSTGLKVDAAIYQQFLGSQMSMLEKRPPPEETSSTSCVYIFLEVTPKTPKADMHREWGPLAKKSKSDHSCRIMAMANTDQFTVDMFELPNLELILCKTRQCVSWIQEKQAERESKVPILFTGFTSRPPPGHDATITDERFNRFLHVAGQSPHKGTWNILQAWLQHPDWPKLTLTSYKNQMVDTVKQQIFQQLNIHELPANIEHINTKLPQDELDKLMHAHGVHLCLSGMEGFGHYLNEARAVGALTLATNHPAMNEIITEDTGGILLEPTNLLEWTNGLSFGNVGAPELARVMNEVVLPMSTEERKEKGKLAQAAFARDREQFEHRMVKFQCYLEKCDGDGKNLKQQSCAEGCGLTLE